MSIGRLPANQVGRKMRDVLGWKAVVFAEHYAVEQDANGEKTILNLSNPLAMAAALPTLLRALRVRSVLAAIVAPRQVIFVPDDESEEVVHMDPRLGQVWRREERMAHNMLPERYAALMDLFREAGVRRGFRGGITAQGDDCLRVSELLALYAFDVCSDVRFLCEQTPLALKACHEADIHVYSQDDKLLASCKRILGAHGLRPYPGGLRRRESPSPWRR